jgi:ubiquinone/menaquinone biosynthesis C-methylase UbiE
MFIPTSGFDRPMAVVPWEQLAEWYDAKQGETGDLWHRALIDPTFLRVVGDVRGLRVLDLGCGNGYLARHYARAGAKVMGVDASAPIIERARAREAEEPLGITYHVADASHLPMFDEGSLDLVASNMALMDMENAEGAIREVGRVLKDRGRFVASFCHPCFDQGPSSTWLIERFFRSTKVWRKIARYRKPFADDMPWGIEERTVSTIGYHRPLSWYARVLRDAGFLIRSLEEPEPTKEFIEGSPQGPYVVEIPLHLVLEAIKTRA